MQRTCCGTAKPGVIVGLNRLLQLLDSIQVPKRKALGLYEGGNCPSRCPEDLKQDQIKNATPTMNGIVITPVR